MKKPIIAIDCDDVLASAAEAFIAFSNQRWGTRLTIEDIDEDWSAMWQIDEAETIARSKEFHASGLISDYREYDGSLPALEWLASYFDLVVATSRNSSINAETVAWIGEHYEGIFKEIYFSGIYDDENSFEDAHLVTKAEMLGNIGASYLIDDQPKHCNAAAEAGMNAILFGDYPWNRRAEIHIGVTRCKTWDEVRGYFEAIRG